MFGAMLVLFVLTKATARSYLTYFWKSRFGRASVRSSSTSLSYVTTALFGSLPLIGAAALAGALPPGAPVTATEA